MNTEQAVVGKSGLKTVSVWVRQPLFWIVVLALCLRFGAGSYHLLKRGVVGDKNWYTLTENLLDGKGLIIDTPGATIVENYRSHRPPLLPLLLAGVRAVTLRKNIITVLFLAAVSAAVVIPVCLIGKELFGQRVGHCAAIITAVYPLYVVHDACYMESGLYCLLVACLVLSLIRFYRSCALPWAVGAGVCLGLAALTRASCAPALPLFCAWFLIFPRTRFAKRVAGMGLFIACFAVLLCPWIIRNYHIHGKPVYVTGGGRSMWIGNNETVASMYPVHSIDAVEWIQWGKLTPEERGNIGRLSEIETDIWFKARAVEFIRAHPRETAKLVLRKMWAGFSPVMNPRDRDEVLKYLVYTLTYGPILVLGLCGIALTRRQWKEFIPVVILVGAFVAVSAVYWAHSRHRVFLDVYLIVCTSYCIVRCIKWFIAGEEITVDRPNQRK